VRQRIIYAFSPILLAMYHSSEIAAHGVEAAAGKSERATETYLVDGKQLSADQCLALFGAMPLFDRQIKVLERIEGDTIVDVGCYSGAFVHEASRRFPDKTVIGVDYFEDNIRIAHLLYPAIRERFQKMSIYRLEIGDASVDCVTLQEVLEHLEGAALAVKEVNRVLRPGGALIVSVPNPLCAWRMAKFFWLELGNLTRRWRGRSPRLTPEVLSDIEWDRHVYAWTPQTLLALLVSNGFEYVEHCYETGVADRLRRWFLAALPFLGPTLILKVRKVSPAPAALV
jgi:2-polyprenyl-3-methyl-5-hydroxy-6-metoxy-1,4-benzoquinol methylase